MENIQFLRLKIIAPGVGTIWVGNVGRGPRWPGRLEKTIANIQLYHAGTIPYIVNCGTLKYHTMHSTILRQV